MKSLLLFLLLIVPGFVLFAQIGLVEPLDSGWTKFMEKHSVNDQLNDTLGGIPSPTKYHFLPTNNTKSVNVFPSIYDLRIAGPNGTSLLNPVRNQGVCGSCWSFAAFGCLESGLKKEGLGVFNFSENNMKNCHKFYFAPCAGGNIDMVISYLARRDGPILESDDPYFDGANPCIEGLNEQLYLTDFVLLPKNTDTLKKAIMDHGAIYTNMYWATSFYNSTNYTYYKPTSTSYNHLVMLIGWDDSKVTAGGTGAWICQNSWGTTWGQNGFFYISYNDAVVNISVGYFAKKKVITNDLFSLYQQDELGATGGYGYNDSIGFGIVKYVSENNFDITSISTYAKSSNTSIEISIYSQFSNGTLSGLLAAIPIQICTHPGYYTFDLPTPIVIPEGDDYYIKVKYIAPVTGYPIPIEMGILSYSYPVITGSSWVSHFGVNNTWYNISNYDIAIKVYAKANVSAMANSIVNPSCYGASNGLISLQTWGGQPPYTYTWNTTPQQYTSSIINLPVGNYSCTITDAVNKSTVYSFKLTQPDSIQNNIIIHENNPCYGQSIGKIKIFAANTSFNEYFASSILNVTSSLSTNPESNLIGPPNGISWAPDFMQGQYLIVGYSSSSKINKVKIYEKMGSGSIDTVFVRNALTGSWHIVWTGIPFFVQHDSIFDVSFNTTNFEVDAIKISLNSTLFPFYPLIDAVGICAPYECNYQWNNGEIGNMIQNLNAGQYTVTISNAMGCQRMDTFLITQPDSLMVTAMNDTIICAGNIVALNATATGNITWFQIGQDPPLLSNLVTPMLPVTFVVKAQTTCGVVYDSVFVDVYSPPFINSLNDTTICFGNSITLNATGNGQINWYIQGATDTLFNLTLIPQISTHYVATASNGVCPMVSDTMFVNLIFSPVPAGYIFGDTILCQGQSNLNYSVPAISNATSYIWSLPDGASGSSTTNSILVSYGLSAISGIITVYGTNMCGNGDTSNLIVTVNVKPVTPVITQNENILHSNAPFGNQWVNQNGLIYGAVNQDYTVILNGNYHVITNLLGCSSNPSNSIYVILSGIVENEKISDFKVYPNPATDILTISSENGLNILNVKIYDLQGKLILNIQNDDSKIDISQIKSGLYIIQITTESQDQYHMKLTITK